ncbi:MAG: DUF3806 domain-containing protein [Halioglobus sp.]|nr:DUF3806 domain-containing protein [Halioglobus sp.]
MPSLIRALAITLLLILCSPALATDLQSRVEQLSKLDLTYMEQQRQLIQELAGQRLGRYFNGTLDNDLALLQELLDKRVVKGSQTRELQAMGLIMGEHLQRELGLNWVIYVDKVGRTRALRYREGDHYLFPMTMIARRREVGNEEPVIAIYARARDKMLRSIPANPYAPALD